MGRHQHSALFTAIRSLAPLLRAAAPEVLAGDLYGTSQDVWGLGITLYELLHGRVGSCFMCHSLNAASDWQVPFKKVEDVITAEPEVCALITPFSFPFARCRMPATFARFYSSGAICPRSALAW